MRTEYRFAMGLAALALGCGDDGDGDGSLRVQLSAEETITEGVMVGQGEENTRDYTVTYSKFLIALGGVRMARSADGMEHVDATGYVADLRQVGEEGLTVTTFENVEPGQWDQFGFQTPLAAAGFQKLGGVSDADVQAMIDGGLTYWIEGTVQVPGKPLNFSFKVPIASTYTQCANDGEPGVSVGEGTSTATITIHGDHLWFDTLVRGDEQLVTRRAGWLVAAAAGKDSVTLDDLKTVRAADVFPASEYSLTGGDIEIATAYDFVRAQLASQGHLNGEGECTAKAN